MNRPALKLLVAAALGALITVGCAKAPPPPAAASAEIPLSGKSEKLDKVESHKYLHYAVGENIQAAPEDVWTVLTKAKAYPKWNSTVESLEGTIAKGEELALKVHISKRTFHPNVSEFDPATSMVWRDGNDAFEGVRTFTLEEREDGSTDFRMKEAYRGSMMKMIAKKLPDFGPDFDAFAADLKREAEAKFPLAEPEIEIEPPASDELSAQRENGDSVRPVVDEGTSVSPVKPDEGTSVSPVEPDEGKTVSPAPDR